MIGIPSTGADTRSPWTDAYRAPANAGQAMAACDAPRPGAATAPAAPHLSREPDGIDRAADQWTSEALFILYNQP